MSIAEQNRLKQVTLLYTMLTEKGQDDKDQASYAQRVRKDSQEANVFIKNSNDKNTQRNKQTKAYAAGI